MVMFLLAGSGSNSPDAKDYGADRPQLACELSALQAIDAIKLH
jgi:hypothetical protein